MSDLNNRVSPFTVLLFCSALLTSLSASANRPAMEERGPAGNVPADVPANMDETEAVSPEAPSAVELMMQQQQQGSVQVQTGDVVELPPVEMRPGETLKINILDEPRRGASMNSVQRQMGEPLSISDTVGQPPITRWVYADRIVFFEHSTVLHVVPRN